MDGVDKLRKNKLLFSFMDIPAAGKTDNQQNMSEILVTQIQLQEHHGTHQTH